MRPHPHKYLYLLFAVIKLSGQENVLVQNIPCMGAGTVKQINECLEKSVNNPKAYKDCTTKTAAASKQDKSGGAMNQAFIGMFPFRTKKIDKIGHKIDWQVLIDLGK